MPLHKNDYVMKNKDLQSQCLQCGSEITYGRPDKKFCCPQCKNIYNNKNSKYRTVYRHKVDRALSRNYEILCNLEQMGMARLPLSDAVAMGFSPSSVTSYVRFSPQCAELRCYDIAFRISDANIFNIHRLSLNLGPLTSEK